MFYSNLSTKRILSIDVFRGITILVMIFVNELAGIRGIPQWAEHMPANADAMSFVDVVFPAFLFIAGMSVPFAINSRLAKGDSFFKLQQHIIFRTLGLLVLGFFMVNTEGGYSEQAMGMSINVWALLFYIAIILVWKVYYTKNKILVYALKLIGAITLVILAVIYKGENGESITPRWWGILGLIGWAYFYSCLLYQLCKGNKYLLLLIVAVCTAWYAMAHSNVLQGSGFLQFLQWQSGNASHTSIMLCGIIVSLIFFEQKKTGSLRNRFAGAFIFTAILFLAGYFLRPYYQISKIHATPTWCQYCAAICTLIFSFLYWLVDIKKIYKWTSFFKPAASNPLLIYIIPDIIYYLTALLGITLFPDSLSYGWPGTIWSLVFAVAVMAIAMLLNKLKLKLQL